MIAPVFPTDASFLPRPGAALRVLRPLAGSRKANYRASQASARPHLGLPVLVLCAESRRRSRQEDLHPLEALEVTRQRPRRCSCGAKLSRRPKCMSLVDIYRPWSCAQEGGSTLILEFLQRKPQIWAALLRPEYHTWHSHTKKFHKELSESVATLHALMHSGFRTRAEAATFGWHAVDLCCGKSLTSALLSLESDAPKAITAVDWRDPSELPHHEEALARDRAHAEAAYADVPVTYLQHDVLADDFLPTLQRRIEDVGRPTAVLGMHLCGRLSLQAIRTLEIDLVQSLVLTPCCLPAAREAPEEIKDIYGGGLSDPEQFEIWAAYLEKLLRSRVPARVTRRVETGILSSRCTMFTATK